MKGSICRRGTVQSRSLHQVGDQVADGGAVGDTGGASEGPTHLFDSGVIYGLAAEHVNGAHRERPGYNTQEVTLKVTRTVS